MFSEIGKFESPLAELSKNIDILPENELNRPIDIPKYDGVRLPKSEGQWTGERGDSVWKPNRDYVPSVYNPEGKTWGQILDENNTEGIPFKDGEPDFKDLSKGTVEVKEFSDRRDVNFHRADEALAQQRGCTIDEIQEWRDENDLTWHECSDCKTMQAVSSELHDNIPHSGGISRIKELNRA